MSKQPFESYSATSPGDWSAQGKPLYMTFDDGPTPGVTESIVFKLADWEQRLGVPLPVTFFVLGRHIECAPLAIKLAHAYGHYIANHSYYHQNFTRAKEQGGLGGDHIAIWEQVGKTNELVERLIGVKPEYLRPPGGGIDASIRSLLNSKGMTPVLWDVDPQDFLTDGVPEFQRVGDILSRFFGRLSDLEGTNGGDSEETRKDKSALFADKRHVITLHHDGRDNSPGWGRQATLNALDSIVPALVGRGYVFRTITPGWIP
ncbi:MAG TPA: polysaccharide deacetylase family protein [Candidatus Binataceae bacterium]|nr:polysaccharide deacetylase family protein [Candidatus Binataceae bacterium]